MKKPFTHKGVITIYDERFKKYITFLRETPKFWISSYGRRFRKDGPLKGWGSDGRKLDLETITRIEVTG